MHSGLIHGSLGPTSQYPKRQLDKVSRLLQGYDQHTDRQTDRQTDHSTSIYLQWLFVSIHLASTYSMRCKLTSFCNSVDFIGYPDVIGITDGGLERKTLRFPQLRRVTYFALRSPLLTAILELHLADVSRYKTCKAEQTCIATCRRKECVSYTNITTCMVLQTIWHLVISKMHFQLHCLNPFLPCKKIVDFNPSISGYSCFTMVST